MLIRNQGQVQITHKVFVMYAKLIRSALLACVIAQTATVPAQAAPTQEENFKEMQEIAERMRKQQEKWEEDSRRAREERKRIMERQEADRRREAELRRQQETREAAEIAAAKSRDKQKSLEKARKEAQARQEQAERDRQVELKKLQEVEEALKKRKEAYDKEVEELRKQGKLGGEINFGVDL